MCNENQTAASNDDTGPSLDDRRERTGLLVIGHGTRDTRGVAEFLETVRRLAEHLHPLPVEPAFLELAEPTIREGWRTLVARGPRRVLVAPLLLFAAGHAKQDIPAQVAAAAQEFPVAEYRQLAHLGCHPSLIEQSALRVLDAIGSTPAVPEKTLLVVVGRGSRDPEATAETHRYADLVRGRLQFPTARTAFLAMAEPRLPEVLNQSASSSFDTLVVLPHLLFHGELLVTVRSIVEDFRNRYPHKTWLVANHLGPEAGAEALLGRLGLLEAGGWRLEARG